MDQKKDLDILQNNIVWATICSMHAFIGTKNATGFRYVLVWLESSFLFQNTAFRKVRDLPSYVTLFCIECLIPLEIWFSVDN